MTEKVIEDALIHKLTDLKYIYRPEIRDRASLEANFRKKFEELNRVNLTDGEFDRLLLALMEDLIPLLHKRAQGREISGLSAYEQ